MNQSERWITFAIRLKASIFSSSSPANATLAVSAMPSLQNVVFKSAQQVSADRQVTFPFFYSHASQSMQPLEPRCCRSWCIHVRTHPIRRPLKGPVCNVCLDLYLIIVGIA